MNSIEKLKAAAKKLNEATDEAVAELDAVEKELSNLHVGQSVSVATPIPDFFIGYGRWKDRFRIVLTRPEQGMCPWKECSREEKIQGAKFLSLLVDALVLKTQELVEKYR